MGCEIKYLKDGGFLPQTFPSKPPTTPCNALDTFVTETLKKLRVEYEKVNYDGKCVEKAFKDGKMQRFWFLKNAYAKASHINQAAKDSEIKKVKEQEKQESSRVLRPCIEGRTFNELFDHLYSNTDADLDKNEEYCVRKYCLENKLVDRSYNVKINPRNIDTTKVNCDALIKESRKDSEKSFTDERGYSIDKKICFSVAFKNGKFFDNIALVSILKGTGITTNQLTVEKNKFNNAMVKFMKDISECVGQ